MICDVGAWNMVLLITQNLLYFLN